MGLATFRNTDTGELLQLAEDWLTRFPNDPYTPVDDAELEKLETEQRQAEAAALGAKPFDQGEQAPEGSAEPVAPIVSKSSDAGDTGEPPTNTRDERRF